MIMYSNDKECVGFYCNCGCENGVIIRANKDIYSGDCELSLVSDIYYIVQKPWHVRFKEKCKRIWKILRNREHEYFNIYIDAKDMKEFKDFIAKIEQIVNEVH